MASFVTQVHRTMDIVGSLTLHAHWRQGRLQDLVVQLRRPAVTQLFLGQSCSQVLHKVPHLYSLCAQAQQAAAQAALDAARAAPEQARPDAALWIELLHEGLWRLLLDWPSALGLPVAKEAFVAWRAARQRSDCAAQTAQLVDGPLQQLATRCLEQLQGADPAPDAAPPLDPAAGLAHWPAGDSAWLAVPALPSVRAAYRARWNQVRSAAEALAQQAPYPLARASRNGVGIAQVLTARGVLTHAAQLQDGRVSAYRVWAPTDLHFADASALQALLQGQEFASAAAARSALQQALLALDPCVPFVVELHDA
ncbi:MAG: hypothetical protein ACR2I0_05350, partial [Rhodoferax sp.]